MERIQIQNLLKKEIPEELIDNLLEHYQKANNEFLKELGLPPLV